MGMCGGESTGIRPLQRLEISSVRRPDAAEEGDCDQLVQMFLWLWQTVSILEVPWYPIISHIMRAVRFSRAWSFLAVVPECHLPSSSVLDRLYSVVHAD
jgi:hypothetical protein